MGLARWRDVWRRFSGRGAYPHELAFLLTIPLRPLAAAGSARAMFVQGDGSHLPFAPGSFDVAFLVAVLGEIPDPAGCVESLHRVLRPGGLLRFHGELSRPPQLNEPVCG